MGRPRYTSRCRSQQAVLPVAYCRVSSERQKSTGLSLDDQERQLRAWCEAQCADALLLKDEALSGTDKDRPAYREARRLLLSGERNLLVVTKLDRLARSIREVLDVADAAAKEGWGVVVLDGSLRLDSRDANGRLILHVMAALGQWEAEMAKERTVAAMGVKRMRGEPGLIPPDVESLVVSLVPSKGLLGTAQHLERCGVATAKGGRWAASTVRRIVRRHGL